MNTKPQLEFIVPLSHPAVDLWETISSLQAQTDRRFSVLLSENFESQGASAISTAMETLSGAGIPARRLRPNKTLNRIEHWNWIHSQSIGGWLKPLKPGDKLMPHFVAKCLQRAALEIKASLIQCDYVIQLPTGGESNPVVFKKTSFTREEFFELFLKHGNCIGGQLNVCYRRDSALAVGGLSVHLPYSAHHNLHLRLCLESGVEIIPEVLVSARRGHEISPDMNGTNKFSRWIEKWLVLRQAEIYCKNSKLPWPKRGVLRGLLSHGKNNVEVMREAC